MEVNYSKICCVLGESEVQYKSHTMRNSVGLVTCPKLRRYKCNICHATGDNAHTEGNCPLTLTKVQKINQEISKKYEAAMMDIERLTRDKENLEASLKETKSEVAKLKAENKSLTNMLSDIPTKYKEQNRAGKLKTVATRPVLGKPLRDFAPVVIRGQAPGQITEPPFLRPMTPRRAVLKILGPGEAKPRGPAVSSYIHTFNPPIASTPLPSSRSRSISVISGVKRTNVTMDFEKMRINVKEELKEGSED